MLQVGASERGASTCLAIEQFMAILKKHLLAAVMSCSVLTSAAEPSSLSSSASLKPPNFIVILTDDQGYADVGFNGSQDIATPNIDRIADEGTRFTNGYVTFSVCGPSRAGLLTGRYQDRFGFGRNPVIDPADPRAGLPVSEKMISEVLQPVGYTSAIIGKWHMGAHPVFHPNKRGFDYFYGFLSGGHRYFPEELTVDSIDEAVKENAWYRTKIMQNNQRIDIDEYLTDELSNEAVSFIEREQDNPFFLYLAYNAPHTPLQATSEYLKRNRHIRDKNRRTYAAMITAVDDGVGRVLDTLEQLDIDDNTLVFFLSDNGGSRKNASNNTPLRGNKGEYFEGGIHVPFAVSWPGVIPSGVDYHHPVSSLDIMATLASMADAPISEEYPLDGVNLIPYITGKNSGLPHEVLFWRGFDQGTLAMRQGDVKVMHSRKYGDHLYDLKMDPGEKNNLVEENKAMFSRKKQQMEAWAEELIDPVIRPLRVNKKEKG